MKNNGDFYALLFQMKNIARWGLMYNTRQENLVCFIEGKPQNVVNP